MDYIPNIFDGFFIIGGGGSVSGFVVQDTFTDSDSTGLDAHTPDVDSVGSGWVEHAGIWEIQSNKLAAAVSGGAQASIDSGESDVDINSTITFTGTSKAGFVTRYTDADNYWQVWMDTGNYISLYERTTGTTTLRDSATPTIDSATYAVQVTAVAQVITVFLDEVEVLTYASAAASETVTRHGVITNATSTGVTFDDFTVGAL